METMDEKNKRMQLERDNHKKLSIEVQSLVVGALNPWFLFLRRG